MPTDLPAPLPLDVLRIGLTNRMILGHTKDSTQRLAEYTARVRAAALAEAADAVWENRAVSYALEIEGWEGAHALLRRLAAAPNPTTQETEHA